MKNNLQTVAALLRLQARRTAIPEARAALAESVRRVTSIALVHETLSASVDERVDLDELVDKVLPAIGDGATAESRAKVRRDGSFGIAARRAGHAAGDGAHRAGAQRARARLRRRAGRARSWCRRERSARRLDVVVADDGHGLPAGLRPGARPTGLGLQIVRTLLDSELDSSLQVRPRPGGGTEAVIRLSLRGR